MSYQPQPGTIPHKVVQYLRQHPGQQFAEAVLTEEVGHTGIQLTQYIKPAIQAGLVIHHRGINRHNPSFFELGDGVPLPSGHEVDDDPIIPRFVPATSKPAAEPKKKAPAVPKLEVPPDSRGVDIDKAHTKAPVRVETVEPELQAAVWNDGRLLIQIGDWNRTLTVKQHQQLVDFLERLAGVSG